MLRDEMAYFISNNFDFFVSDSEAAAKSYQDIASDYLRKFASKDVAWIEEEFDDSTFEKYIVITEPGILLAELLTRLECQTANYNRVQQQIKIPSDTYQTARSCL